ncbi:ATP-grasp domain-containing protein [Kitasatospora cineracea]|uniref:ATP-grasp domain-containing protein n=1 Tax=Kitasatospora cineracea TaxID=88074 RepID=UPI0033E0B295
MADHNRPRLAVVYDYGAASPSQIAKGLRDIADLRFVVPRSEHVRSVLPVLEQFAPVTMLDRATNRGALPERADGILTFSERMLPATARLAEQLDLRFHTLDCVTGLTDKQRQRALFAEAGIDSVRHRIASDPAGLTEALEHVGVPCVVKPRRGEGSRNAYPVHDDDAATAVIQRLTDGWPLDPASGQPMVMIVEEFLSGMPTKAGIGDYVSVESAVVEGIATHFAVTGKFALAQPFRETGQFWPALVDCRLAEEIVALTDAALSALSVRSGICHTEIKLTPSGPRLIEVNGRLGRDIAELAQRCHGTDLIALAGKIALEHPVVPSWPHPKKVYFQFHHPSPPDADRITAVAGQQSVEAMAGVASYSRVPLPAEVSGVSTSHFDALRGVADSHGAMLELIDRASRALSFWFRGPSPGGGEARVHQARGSELRLLMG